MISDGLDVFGEDFDRFAFPGDIHRVTAGYGGEAILIIGSGETAMIDCGMAYCGSEMVDNLRKKLKERGRESLDHLLLTHSHYDHMGALPYIREAFPDCIVYGSRHCSEVLGRPGAKALMKELGTAARDLYAPESDLDIPVDDLRVDVILEEGDEVSLGEETIRAMETRGHTDCSMTYALEPLRLLFTSESTGLIEAGFQIGTPVLKSFGDAFVSLQKCMDYEADYVCLPHFGMIPQDFNEEYWDMFRDECLRKLRMVEDMKERGMDRDQMLDGFKDVYWKPVMELEQPIEAFLINHKNVIKAALKYMEAV